MLLCEKSDDFFKDMLFISKSEGYTANT